MANVSEQDYELLSAYVDGMLDEDERLTLEARLRSDADLLHELTALYLTLAMVKQLPMMTAPRNFTLKDPPARWLMFPTTPLFSVLSAAAATILVIIGIGLLSTTFMSGTASTPSNAAQQEVALQSNQTNDTTATSNEQPAPNSNDSFDENQQDAQLTDAGQLTSTAQSLTIDDIQTTATAMALRYSTTVVANYAATTSILPDTAGGGIAPIQGTSAPTMTAPPTFDPAGASLLMSTETIFPPVAQSSTMVFGTQAPPNQDGVSADANASMDARQFAPTATMQAMSAEVTEEDAETEMFAQVPSEAPSMTALPTMTVSPTVTTTATVAPTSVPPSASAPSQISPILGIVLVIGGALLFGVAFMTAAARRANRRGSK